jgi:hypothetical protein
MIYVVAVAFVCLFAERIELWFGRRARERRRIKTRLPRRVG